MGPVLLTILAYHLNKQYHNVSNAVLGHYYEPLRDIVCVTGGSRGLGREIAQRFAERHTTTVVLDVVVPAPVDRVPNVHYYVCDVADSEQVLAVAARVAREVGVVTILVNNAGITHGKTLIDLDYDEIERTIRVNLLSSFYTIKAFLPNMLSQKRGYIVTIASVLGYMSPARLSDYGASKSGLIALHESLTYELGPPSLAPNGIKTLLICPGQLKTRMFSSIPSPLSLFAPELDPKYVSQKLVAALEVGRRGEIKLPFYGNLMPIMRAIPWPVVEFLRDVSGMDRSMAGFKVLKNKIASARGSRAQSEVTSVKEDEQ